MYIYESHMGGLYTLDEQADFDFLYCEQCGDSDWEIGYAETREEAWALLESYTDMFDESLCEKCPHNVGHDVDECYSCENYLSGGGYILSYVKEFIESHFDV